MDLIEKHAEFAQSIEEAERANNRLAMLGGIQGYFEIYQRPHQENRKTTQ